MSYDKPKPDPIDYDLPPTPYGEDQLGPPPVPMAARGRGCLFYGCVTAAVLMLLVLALLAVGLYLVNREAARLVAAYTATEPVQLPVVALPQAEQEALEQRLDAFTEAAKAGQTTEISLTPEQINAIIARQEKLRGKVAVEIQGDVLLARVSIPLGDMGLPSFVAGGLQGRYLNGTAWLEPSIAGDQLHLLVRDLEVKGQKVDRKFLAELQQDGPIEIDLDDDESGDLGLHNVDQVTVRQGHLILRVRPTADTTAPEAAVPTAPPATRNNTEELPAPDVEPAAAAASATGPGR